MKTALVYDWLVTIGGGEKTLQAIDEIFPSPIHTLVYDSKRLANTGFANKRIVTSFIQKLPFSKRGYRNYLPFFPMAIEQFDLSSFDVILSTSHAVAKGVLTSARQLHLCYCLTPMRYAWDLTHSYLEEMQGLQKIVARASLHYLRNWDIASLNRVDYFAAISKYVARRIQKIYRRDAEVIYPPVDVEIIPYRSAKSDYFITVSRLVPYKKIDMIVETFNRFPEKKLVVVGDGPEMKKVKSKAGNNVEILGWQPDEKVHSLLADAKGFIFAAEEDFGIAVIEAQAAGTPVIALGKGAVMETVVPYKTGLFFPDQTSESLSKALIEFERIEFNPADIREFAQHFNCERFKKEFKCFVERKIEDFNEIHYSRGR